jgi:NAD(P)-dependent dehydrogenase (short-subunit alcohol dehydrogenase family)
VDTADEKAVADALTRSQDELGPVDILVNAVGGNMGKTDFIDTDLNRFAEVIECNLMAGLMVPTKVVAAHWIKMKIKGSIINLASMASYNPLSGVWAYDAAKAAVLNLTRATANEFAVHGIRVNAPAPGFFLGKQNRALLMDENSGRLTPRGRDVISRTPGVVSGISTNWPASRCFRPAPMPRVLSPAYPSRWTGVSGQQYIEFF